jgi:hypothetical protein
MTTPRSLSRIRQARPRRVHLVMRDGAVVEGHVHIVEDQALVNYLNSRRGGWVNLTRAHRPKLNEPPGHIILQSRHIVLASAPDGGLPVSRAPSSGVEERGVEIVLLGGKIVRGFVTATSRQRLSDYIGALTGQFLGVQRASLALEGRALGDLALNMDAIDFLRDLRDHGTLDESPSATEPSA